MLDRIKAGGRYMAENERLYPISAELFTQESLPIIEGNYIWKGRPPKVSHYKAFCGILYILRTGFHGEAKGDYGQKS
jgi:hypothetical protein